MNNRLADKPSAPFGEFTPLSLGDRIEKSGGEGGFEPPVGVLAPAAV